jgi:hypothetical protein
VAFSSDLRWSIRFCSNSWGCLKFAVWVELTNFLMYKVTSQKSYPANDDTAKISAYFDCAHALDNQLSILVASSNSSNRASKCSGKESLPRFCKFQ